MIRNKKCSVAVEGVYQLFRKLNDKPFIRNRAADINAVEFARTYYDDTAGGEGVSAALDDEVCVAGYEAVKLIVVVNVKIEEIVVGEQIGLPGEAYQFAVIEYILIH